MNVNVFINECRCVRRKRGEGERKGDIREKGSGEDRVLPQVRRLVGTLSQAVTEVALNLDIKSASNS